MLDVNQIKEIIPHRYPMLLIDRVVEMDIEDKMFVKGYKNVSANEAYFKGIIHKNQLCQVFYKLKP
jgi:3-hydroxyacyl-[acyl-carrier-protein] dehydratase